MTRRTGDPPRAGAVVTDLANEERPRLIVMRVLESTAAETVIEALGETVAEADEQAEPDEPVVEACYADDLDRTAPGWRDVHETVSADGFETWLASYEREWGVTVQRYSFAAGRLDEPAAEASALRGGIGRTKRGP